MRWRSGAVFSCVASVHTKLIDEERDTKSQSCVANLANCMKADVQYLILTFACSICSLLHRSLYVLIAKRNIRFIKKHVASSSFLEKPQCVGQHGAGNPLVEMLKVVLRGQAVIWQPETMGV